jgi:hypothetical protein
MQDLNFVQIVNSTVSLQGRPLESRACPDHYLGPLTTLIGQPDFLHRLPASQRTNAPCLIMVLESPHVDEFSGEPGPAKGFTGEMIRKYLSDALDVSALGAMGLVLMNAIQYQCSLGSNTTVYRDRVFRAVWSQGGQEDFLGRFKVAAMPHDVVMNCCTKGNDFDIHPPLRNLVEATIRSIRPEVQTIRRMHPASWRDPSWRGKEWRYQEIARSAADRDQSTLAA